MIDVLDEPEIATPWVRRVALSGGMFVLIGGAIWQLSNFLFNAVAAHALGPAGYATVAAIVGFAYLFGPVFVALQTIFTVGIALMLATGTTFFRDVRHLVDIALSVP